MARKTKLTPQTQDRICESIRLGATYELAAHGAGITYETFRDWMNTKPSFSAAVKAAEGDAAAKWLTMIEQAALEGNWHAAAWKLERRYPRDYGRTVQQQEVSGGVEIRITKRPEPGAVAGGEEVRS